MQLYYPNQQTQAARIVPPKSPYQSYKKVKCPTCLAIHIIVLRPEHDLPPTLSCAVCSHKVSLGNYQDRLFRRHSVEKEIEYWSHVDKKIRRGELLDISPTGARMQSIQSIQPMDYLRITVSGKPVMAQPVWSLEGKKFQIGLQFSERVDWEQGFLTNIIA